MAYGSLSLIQDIARRGSAAINDYRSQNSGGSYNPAASALDTRQRVLQAFSGAPQQSYEPSGSGTLNQLYDQWATQYGGGAAPPIVYGQSKAGKYAGFKNESDLWNAVEGKAVMSRRGSQAQANQIKETAQQKLAAISAAYDKALHDAILAMNKEDEQRGQSSFAGVSAHGSVAQAPTGPTSHTEQQTVGGVPVASQVADTPDPTQAGAHIGDVTYEGGSGGHPAARRYQSGPNTGSLEATPEQERYKTQLKDWLSQQSEPLAETMKFADEVQQTPLSFFANVAGQQYGVDPNIVQGRFGDKEDVTDFGTERNLGSINQYGLPYSEVLGLQGDAQDAQTAAAKQGDKDQETALEAELQAQTGQDPTQLASAANITVPQLAEVVASPDYQQTSAQLQQILDSAQDDPQGAQAAFEDNLRQIGSQDPVLMQVLLAQFKPYGASASDFFNSDIGDSG